MFLFVAVTCSGSTLGMGKAFFSWMKSKGIFLLHFRVTVKSRSKLVLQLGRQVPVCLLPVCMGRWAQGRKRGAERRLE